MTRALRILLALCVIPAIAGVALWLVRPAPQPWLKTCKQIGNTYYCERPVP